MLYDLNLTLFRGHGHAVCRREQGEPDVSYFARLRVAAVNMNAGVSSDMDKQASWSDMTKEKRWPIACLIAFVCVCVCVGPGLKFSDQQRLC